MFFNWRTCFAVYTEMFRWNIDMLCLDQHCKAYLHFSPHPKGFPTIFPMIIYLLQCSGGFNLNPSFLCPGSPSYRVLKGGWVSKGRGCSWGTLRIPFGKIGEP